MHYQDIDPASPLTFEAGEAAVDEIRRGPEKRRYAGTSQAVADNSGSLELMEAAGLDELWFPAKVVGLNF